MRAAVEGELQIHFVAGDCRQNLELVSANPSPAQRPLLQVFIGTLRGDGAAQLVLADGCFRRRPTDELRSSCVDFQCAIRVSDPQAAMRLLDNDFISTFAALGQVFRACVLVPFVTDAPFASTISMLVGATPRM